MAERLPRDFGDYRLLRKLAQGGMAEIFLAQDKQGKICALKRILPHLAHQEAFIRMFIDEARIVSQLAHPNITAVYDQGKHEGYYYIAMEFVQGHSLLAFTERAKSTRMPLPHGLLAYVVSELLSGLGFAHAARDKRGRELGIVHRDVTPQNVLISYDGEVKLIDFGVAKARARLTQTEAGFTKGKLSYMSPEQARGELLDGRSDLFSVGIILHELTTNSRLFNREGPGGILGAIVNEPIPRPSDKRRDYPPELERIVMRALDKDVHRRWQTAEEMQDALLSFSQRERPAPSPARLQELVYDLFGASESAELIAQLRVAATAGSRAPVEAPPAPPPSPPPPPPGPGGNETRVFDPEAPPPEPSRVEVTADAVPVVAVQAAPPPPPPEVVEVPEVEAPRRVQAGRFVDALARDLRLSWRRARRRWLVGGAAALLLLVGGLLAYFGVFSQLAGWAHQAREAARELKGEGGAPAPARAPPVLTLRSEPPGAAISVDGIGMGQVTPATLKGLPLGRELTVQLTHPGYRPKQASLRLQAGRGDQELELQLDRAVGGLKLTGSPAGAVATVGRSRCKLPCVLRGLPVGSARLVVRSPGHQRKQLELQIQDGELLSVQVDLLADLKKAAPGRLTVKSEPSGCRVLLDDRPIGQTPLSKRAVAPGLRQLRVECTYYEVERRSVDIFSGQEQVITARPQPNTFGFLSVSVRPSSGNRVFVGGRQRQDRSNIRLVAGRHEVVVINDLYGQRRASVNVRPNQTQSLSINFTR